MLENNNKEIIKKLSERSFKINKIRNLVSILAIVLTTVLFTSLFTVGYTLLEAFNNYTMMEYGMSTHAQIQDVSDEQIDIIKNNKNIDENSIGIVKNIDSAKNLEFSNQTINVAVYDEQSLKNAISVDMIKGSLPKEKDEIVMPTEVLDMLELPYEIGTEIKIDIPVVSEGAYTGEINNYKFKLSGYFKYKTATAMALHDIYVSDKFYNEYKEFNKISPTCVSFNFINDKNLETQLDNLLKEIEPYSGKSSINPAYLNTQVSSIRQIVENMMPVVFIIILILVSGYLLIYNIFYISVIKDIKYYGLLKTIGTSQAQMKKLIINQANRLCLISIPIGLIVGFILGNVFIPMVNVIVDGLSMESSNTFNPIVFVGAAIFSYLTVRISCMKPARIASEVSPIDAVRYSDRTTNTKRKSKKSKNGSKIHKMVISNMFRNKKKAIIVLMSMSLSCMIFLAVSTIISSSNPERAAEGMMLDDIEIQHGESAYANLPDKEIIPIDNNFIKDVENIDGVNSISKIYKDYLVRIAYEGIIKEEMLTHEIEQEYMDLFLEGENPADIAEFQKSISADLEGLSSAELMEKMIENNSASFYGDVKVLEGNIDIEKFNSGGYLIIQGHKNSKIKTGDKLQIKFMKGNTVEEGYITHELEVMAILDGAKNFSMNMYVNKDDFKKIIEKPYVQNIVVDVDGNIDEVEKKIRELNDDYNNPYVHIFSKRKYIEDAKQTQAIITIIGMSAVFIIGLIGVLNFINTMITSIISRRQEFAMIEAVGMTKNQLKKMLILEGAYHGVIISFINITLGSMATFLGYNVMKLRYSVYTYPIESLILATLILFIISILVPITVYKQVSKDSIVERIRETE